MRLIYECPESFLGVVNPNLGNPNLGEEEVVGGHGYYHSKKCWWLPI